MTLSLRQLALGLSLAAAPGLAFAQTSTGQTSPGQPSMTRIPATTGTRTATSAVTSGGVTHYASQSEASSACTGDTVVWASPRSKALHTSGDRYFGKSKHGFFTCEKAAMAGGYHLSGTGRKHKTS